MRSSQSPHRLCRTDPTAPTVGESMAIDYGAHSGTPRPYQFRRLKRSLCVLALKPSLEIYKFTVELERIVSFPVLLICSLGLSQHVTVKSRRQDSKKEAGGSGI